MVTPELLEYIRTQYLAGAAQSEITTVLIGRGWDPADVTAALAQVIAASAPAQARATPTTGQQPSAAEQPAESAPPQLSKPTVVQSPSAIAMSSISRDTSLMAAYAAHPVKDSGVKGKIAGIAFGIIFICGALFAASYLGFVSLPIEVPYPLPISIPGIIVSVADEESIIPDVPTTAATSSVPMVPVPPPVITASTSVPTATSSLIASTTVPLASTTIIAPRPPTPVSSSTRPIVGTTTRTQR